MFLRQEDSIGFVLDHRHERVSCLRVLEQAVQCVGMVVSEHTFLPAMIVRACSRAVRTASLSLAERKPGFSVRTKSHMTISAWWLGESSIVLTDQRPGGSSACGISDSFSSRMRFCSLYAEMIRIFPHE